MLLGELRHVQLDEGGLVEELLADLGQEDEASASVALTGAAGDEAARFEALHRVGEARAREDDSVRQDGGADASLARAVGHEEDGVFGHGEARLAFEGGFDAFGEASRGGEVELPCRRSVVVRSAHGVSSVLCCWSRPPQPQVC